MTNSIRIISRIDWDRLFLIKHNYAFSKLFIKLIDGLKKKKKPHWWSHFLEEVNHVSNPKFIPFVFSSLTWFPLFELKPKRISMEIFQPKITRACKVLTLWYFQHENSTIIMIILWSAWIKVIHVADRREDKSQ